MTDFQEKLLETLDAIRKELIIMNTPDNLKKDQRDVFEEIEILDAFILLKQHAVRDRCEDEVNEYNDKIEQTKQRLKRKLKDGLITR